MIQYSVIVPVYNVSAYLTRCIESVLKQNFASWELILVDDGSTDDSSAICDEYADKDERIQVIHKKNNGVSSARNQGLQAASGKYVTFLDADDYWERTDILSEIDSYPSADVYYMLTVIQRYPTGHKKLLSRQTLFPDTQFSGDVLEYFASRLRNGGWGCYYGFYARTIISNVFFDESIKIGEDADWFFQTMANAKNAYFIKKPYYNYCVDRKGSAMNIKAIGSMVSYFQMISKWREFAESNGRGYRKVFVLLSNNAVDYVRMFGLYDKEGKKLLKQAFFRCGALDAADDKHAITVRKRIARMGFDRYVFFSSIKYRLKLVGQSIKLYIMHLTSQEGKESAK